MIASDKAKKAAKWRFLTVQSTLPGVLEAHFARYPLLQTQDVVKLTYQHTMGCGHMVLNAANCLAHLNNEYEQKELDDTAPLLEPIGNSYLRLMLGPARHQSISAGTIGQMFLESAALDHGSAEKLVENLHLLRENGFVLAHWPDLPAFLQEYEAQGCPALHHSEIYRQNYQPHYRVLHRSILQKYGLI